VSHEGIFCAGLRMNCLAGPRSALEPCESP
jgi:hypothetical protein